MEFAVDRLFVAENTNWVYSGQAAPPSHSPLGHTVVAHVSNEVPQQGYLQELKPGTPRRPGTLNRRWAHELK